MKSISRSDLSWILELATLVAVVSGLSFAAMELRQLRSEQESQTLLQLADTMNSEEYVHAVDLVRMLPDGLDYAELQSRLSEEDFLHIRQLRLTYESIGVLVYRGDISLDWVDELFRFGILTSWTKMAAQTEFEREESGYLGIYEWHQWLAERLVERSDGQPIPAYEAFRDWEP